MVGPPGLPTQRSAEIVFRLGADGTLSHVRVERSSGYAAFDRACLAAFARVGTIGPKPDGRPADWAITFRTQTD